MSESSGSMSAATQLSPMVDGDLHDVLALNNACVPHVNELDRDGLAWIHQQSSVALVARAGTALAAMAILFGPDSEYASPNYRYFVENYDDFLYLDRIAVDARWRRRGLAGELYDEVFARARRAGAPRVVCEVNLDPPNPNSLSLHRSLGFAEVGQQHNDGGGVAVSLLSAELS